MPLTICSTTSTKFVFHCIMFCRWAKAWRELKCTFECHLACGAPPDFNWIIHLSWRDGIKDETCSTLLIAVYYHINVRLLLHLFIFVVFINTFGASLTAHRVRFNLKSSPNSMAFYINIITTNDKQGVDPGFLALFWAAVHCPSVSIFITVSKTNMKATLADKFTNSLFIQVRIIRLQNAIRSRQITKKSRIWMIWLLLFWLFITRSVLHALSFHVTEISIIFAVIFLFDGDFLDRSVFHQVPPWVARNENRAVETFHRGGALVVLTVMVRNWKDLEAETIILSGKFL